MPSRENFVTQVKNKILKEHCKETKASFIFGLSGKWGEGKTRFLENLADELKRAGFEKPIWVSPWKYGDDRISFLRNFLKDVANLSEYSFIKKVFKNLDNFINNKDEFRQLYYDTSQAKIHWGWAIFIWIFLLDLVLFYIFILPEIEIIFPNIVFVEGLRQHYTLLSSLIITPFFIPFISSFLTTQQTNKSVSTIDQFDSLLDKVIGTLKNKKIVVFVDDLDRVTPEVSRNVLDNMRIFFDKPQITFVVTGDHTVLERYIGSLTLPEAAIEMQLEEGRRYLKKVFNLYWRLPLPIKSEFEVFLKALFFNNKTELNKIFHNEDSKNKFALYLQKYFDRNFRQVIRFFDTVLFTFDIIKNQYSSARKNIKKYYKQMLDNPLLVIRILMIQELCMPLFDAILKNTGELRDIEYLIEKKDTGELENKLVAYKTFTPNQMHFIRQFLYEEPRFFKNKVLDVYAFEPFLYLAADSDLGDARGLTKADFTEIIKTGDPDQVANSLQNSGQEKAKEASAATIDLLNLKTDPPVDPTINSGYIRTIVAALTKIPDHFSQQFFINDLKSIDYSKFFSSAQFPNRLQISQEMWKWLDLHDKENVVDYINFFPPQSIDDLKQLELLTSPGYLSSRVIIRWIKSYYPSNKEIVLSSMENILSKIDKKAINDEFTKETDIFYVDILSWGTPEQRERLYSTIIRNIPSTKDFLRYEVFERIKKQDELIWQWAYQKISDSSKPWSQEELEAQIIKSLDSISDENQLLSLIRFAGAKITKLSTRFWEEVGKKYVDKLSNIIPQLSLDSYPTFSPPEKIAKVFFEIIIQKNETGDDAQKIVFIPSLQKKWLWSNIQALSRVTTRRLSKIAKSQDQNITNAVELVLQSWGKRLDKTKAKTIIQPQSS